MIRVDTGQRFNRLTFVNRTERRSGDNHILGTWRCDCGAVKDIMISRVVGGYSRSCGCLVADATRLAVTRHGMRSSRTYSSWSAMKQRCENPACKDYKRYGFLGITLCKEWSDSFESFLSHMGIRPRGTSIDRINWSKGYEPGNCRWSTATVQNRNKANFVVILTPLGISPLVDYAKAIGLTRGAAHLRLKRGKLEGCERL